MIQLTTNNNAVMPNVEHHSQRAGQNRETKDQRKERIIGNVITTVLSLIAAAIVGFIIWDQYFNM